jgi:hypothetical protein
VVTAVASIRLRRGEELRYLLIGLGSSLAMHVLFFLLWLSLGVMAISFQNKLLKDLRNPPPLTEEQKRKQEPPLLFVEVRPDQAAAEPPKDAQYYSALNSLAANPDPQIDTTVPKIDGTQDKVAKTFDTLHPQPEPPQPVPQPEPKPEPVEPKSSSGDINLVKPVEKPQRPKTLVEAKLREGLIAGEKMKQEGGVKRRGIVALDAKSTPFGAYDAIVFQAIQKRWYDLLEDSATPSRQGKVAVTVRMHSDGHITDLKVMEQDVGEILSLYCRKAIADPAPYAPWPSEMREMNGRDYRDIHITFYYQ